MTQQSETRILATNTTAYNMHLPGPKSLVLPAKSEVAVSVQDFEAHLSQLVRPVRKRRIKLCYNGSELTAADLERAVKEREAQKGK